LPHDPGAQAEVLIQAMPYIRRYRGKTVVIKYGGAAMVDESMRAGVMQDLVLLHYVGIQPILVHGGGPEINEAMGKFGKVPQFIQGLRVTDAETMEIVEMVLTGKTNKALVSEIHRQGGQAVGLSGKDGNMLVARKVEGEVDLGFVGEIVKVNPHVINAQIAAEYIPVISSVAVGDNGESYNVNADHVAGAIAVALKAEKLILLTDVPGVLSNKDDPQSLISVLTIAEAKKMIQNKKVDKGMTPKLDACLTAVNGGVDRAHILDGRMPHAILIEVFTDCGIGTMIRG